MKVDPFQLLLPNPTFPVFFPYSCTFCVGTQFSKNEFPGTKSFCRFIVSPFVFLKSPVKIWGHSNVNPSIFFAFYSINGNFWSHLGLKKLGVNRQNRNLKFYLCLSADKHWTGLPLGRYGAIGWRKSKENFVNKKQSLLIKHLLQMQVDRTDVFLQHTDQ